MQLIYLVYKFENPTFQSYTEVLQSVCIFAYYTRLSPNTLATTALWCFIHTIFCLYT
jgi:hypothetical protein